MKLYTHRSLGGIFLFVALVSGWCFLSGFEPGWAWGPGHVATLCILVLSLPLAVIFYALAKK